MILQYTFLFIFIQNCISRIPLNRHLSNLYWTETTILTGTFPKKILSVNTSCQPYYDAKKSILGYQWFVNTLSRVFLTLNKAFYVGKGTFMASGNFIARIFMSRYTGRKLLLPHHWDIEVLGKPVGPRINREELKGLYDKITS